MNHDCKKVTIFVDADACPAAIRHALQSLAAAKSEILVYFVASHNHQLNGLNERVFHVAVDACPEAADLYIANRVKKGDILITQDIGLASLLLSKEAYAISYTGKPYAEETIDEKLFSRHLGAKLRRAGQKTKGPKKYTDDDFRQFERTLNKILSKEGLS